MLGPISRSLALDAIRKRLEAERLIMRALDAAAAGDGQAGCLMQLAAQARNAYHIAQDLFREKMRETAEARAALERNA